MNGFGIQVGDCFKGKDPKKVRFFVKTKDDETPSLYDQIDLTKDDIAY